jgi:hypothetical protein
MVGAGQQLEEVYRGLCREREGRFGGAKVGFSEFNTVVSEGRPQVGLEESAQIDKKTLREVVIYNQTLENVKKALRILKQENVRVIRPNDYYAEMVKSDQQVRRVGERLEQEKKKASA